MASFLWLPIVFCGATLVLYFLASNAPSVSTVSHCAYNDSAAVLQFLSSVDELKAIADILSCYTRSHHLYVFVLFCCGYIYKQTFAIPGSVFLNILAGSLFGIVYGFPLTCLLTAIGATNCYLLSAFFGRTHVVRYFGKHIDVLTARLERNNGSLFLLLLSLRLFPMAPNWLMNIAAPILNIPIYLFFPSVFIGLMPYNFLCVEAGCLLSELSSASDVFSLGTTLKLTASAVVTLVPGLLLQRYQQRQAVNDRND